MSTTYCNKFRPLLNYIYNIPKDDKKHYAFFLEERNLLGKIAFGQNHDRPNYSCSIHAEINALNKLQQIISIKKKKKNKYVNLLVVRLTKNNKIGESRPCFHCLCNLIRSNINIRFVYYSTKDGIIVREKLSTMLRSEKTYISSGHRER